MARKLNPVLIFLLAMLFFGCIQPQGQRPPTDELPDAASVQVFFCPEDDCADHLIQKIDSAQNTILVAIYSFTLDEIADSLIRAKARGVDVRVLFDSGQGQSRYSEDERLAENGVQVRLFDKGSGIMHNKFAVIDEGFVATGSFNYSANADRFNDENLVFLDDTKIAKEYEKEFEELWNQAN